MRDAGERRWRRWFLFYQTAEIASLSAAHSKICSMTDARATGLDAMRRIAAGNSAVLLVHNRETGSDRLVSGKLSVTSEGWVF